jgi:hypothetical protein
LNSEPDSGLFDAFSLCEPVPISLEHAMAR